MGHLTYLELSTTLFLSVVNFSFLSTMTRTLHDTRQLSGVIPKIIEQRNMARDFRPWDISASQTRKVPHISIQYSI